MLRRLFDLLNKEKISAFKSNRHMCEHEQTCVFDFIVKCLCDRLCFK